MKRDKLPFSLRIVQGAIGKRFVVKHYTYGVVKTKFPDMSGVVASKGQRKCRDLFKEAVTFARKVLADENLVVLWQKKLRRNKRLFNALISTYMLAEKKAKAEREMMGRRIIVNSFRRFTMGNRPPTTVYRPTTTGEGRPKRDYLGSVTQEKAQARRPAPDDLQLMKAQVSRPAPDESNLRKDSGQDLQLMMAQVSRPAPDKMVTGHRRPAKVDRKKTMRRHRSGDLRQMSGLDLMCHVHGFKSEFTYYFR